MSQTFWIFVVVTLGIVSTVAMVGLARMGIKAYTTGSAPSAPEAFTSFASRVLRIATIIAIVGATLTLVLATDKTLDSAVTGILSGTAGFVLGGTEKTPRLTQANSHESNKPQGGLSTS